jgi:hypothetical protein
MNNDSGSGVATSRSGDSAYKKCLFIRQALLRTVGEFMVYWEHWAADYLRNSVRETESRLGPLVGHLDLSELTAAEMDELGFGTWGDTGSPLQLRLIPIWLFPFLPEDIAVESIGGDIVTKKKNMDTDHRFGHLAFGLYPADARREAHV